MRAGHPLAAMRTFDPPGLSLQGWPMAIDAEETFYFRPEAGRILASPADETPVPPGDVQPEEIDLALTIDRIEQATTLKIARIGHEWAGLRSFFPDKTPVAGWSGEAPGFFWIAGQGWLRHHDLAGLGPGRRCAHRRSGPARRPLCAGPRPCRPLPRAPGWVRDG